MSKHLISATLSAEAYEMYQEWVKERQASKMISQSIIDQFSDLNQSEQIIKWRNTRLVHLVRIVLRKLSKEDWESINEDDRTSLLMIAKPDKTFDSDIFRWDNE